MPIYKCKPRPLFLFLTSVKYICALSPSEFNFHSSSPTLIEIFNFHRIFEIENNHRFERNYHIVYFSLENN